MGQRPIPVKKILLQKRGTDTMQTPWIKERWIHRLVEQEGLWWKLRGSQRPEAYVSWVETHGEDSVLERQNPVSDREDPAAVKWDDEIQSGHLRNKWV